MSPIKPKETNYRNWSENCIKQAKLFQGRKEWYLYCIPTISGRSGLLNPVSQMTNEIEEEISLGHGYNLIRDFDKQAKPFGGA